MKTIISKYRNIGKALILTVLPIGGVGSLASCADWDEWNSDVEKPETIAQYEYLDKYAPLKENLDRGKHPSFKVSCALGASDFNEEGSLYRLAKNNFDEIVAGNAMKMASCVSEDGTMDFGTVQSFVQAAEDADVSIYGHCLAWHSQQPVKWLDKLIADQEIQVDPNALVDKVDYELDCSKLTSYSWTGSPETVTTEWGKDGAMVITNPAAISDWWTLQYWLVNGISLTKDKQYKITITCKAEGDADANIRFKLGDWSDGDSKNFTIPVGKDYDDISLDVTPTMESNGLFFQHGDFAGKIYWKSIKITHSEAPSVEVYTNVLTNSSLDPDQSMSCFIAREGSGTQDHEATVLKGQGPDGMNCIKVNSPADTGDSWNSQFFITSDKVWAGGDKCRVSFYYKATEASDCETQCHSTPGSYKYWQCLGTNPSFTTEWQHYENTITIPSDAGSDMQTIAFNLNVNKNDVTYYFADIKWETIEKGNKIRLTDEQKKDTLTWAMNQWCTNMMAATEGKVKAWDMINEAISGNGNVNGYYDLQHGTQTEKGVWDVGGENFYWQDYLGTENYGPVVSKAARAAYAAVEGTNPDDLKLFVNDYNLESDWDQNKKVKSLVYWVDVWEKNGAKIDGLGTQMHISYYENDTIQNSKKAAIQNMFKIMAATGKLVRISELDMGYVDKSNNSLTTAQITALPLTDRIAKEKAMADFYQWIIEQYFELVPTAQQYGICQWCLTDSPADSSWRAGQPVGLWNESYQRKPAYGGWAEGLQK